MGSFKANVLDKMSWHAEGEYYPAGLRREQAATHMGMLLAWAIANHLASEKHAAENPLVRRLHERSITPGEYFRQACGEWLQDSDFNGRGEAFADALYDEYLYEYGYLFSDDMDSLYHAPDTWETYELVRELLDSLLAEWAESSSPPSPDHSIYRELLDSLPAEPAEGARPTVPPDQGQ